MWSTKSVVPSLRLLLIMCSAAVVIGIMGGRFARLSMFPHHVSLHVYTTYIAGGSLISDTFVLTCAHCIMHDINTYTVLMGVIDITDTNGQTFLPKEFIQHPQFNLTSLDYDIGLIRLSRPAVINENVQTIGMAPADAIYPARTVALIAGYGEIDPFHTLQNCQKYVYVPTWSTENCTESNFKGITKHGMMCAGDDDGRNMPCKGDSGGGLVVNYILMAVYFMGYGCGEPEYPSVYQYVPYHRQWIDQVMHSQYVRKKKNYWNNTMNAHNVRHKNCNHFNSTNNP